MRVIFILLAIIATQAVNAQAPCHVEGEEDYANWLKTNKQKFDIQYAEKNLSQRSSPNYGINSIPVKVHILEYAVGAGRALDSTQINTLFARLNSDYTDVGLSFYKCGNINYIANAPYCELDYYTEFTPLFNSSAVSNVINLYIVHELTFGNGAAAGLAPTPGGRDFVILRDDAALSSTVTHEFGHYFGLLHTHGFSNATRSKEKVDGSNCSDEGDFFCDTPADPGIIQAVNSQTCQYFGTWGDPNGQPYQPDVANHMSYAPDNCRSHFSAEQKAFMNWIYHEYRSYLQCAAININFTYNAVAVCNSPNSVSFTNTSTGLSNFEWDVNEDDITDYTTTNITHPFTGTGEKYVHLKGTAGGKVYHRYKRIEFFEARTIPSYQDFNTAQLQHGWRIAEFDNARGWELQPTVSADGTTNNVLQIKNYAYYPPEPEDYLYSAAYNLNGITNARLSFDVAYAPTGNSDTLKIYISTDCGRNYSLLQTLHSTSLQSHTKVYYEFAPTSSSDWKTITLNISPYVNNYVRFKIVNVCAGGNSLYLDNFRVEGGTVVKEVGFANKQMLFNENQADVTESCRKYKIIQVPLYISQAPTATVTVLVTKAGNAKPVHDYVLLDSVVTFPANSTNYQYIRVKIYNDASVESTETIRLTATQITGNGFAASNNTNSCTISIKDNDDFDLLRTPTDTLLLNETFNNVNYFIPDNWTAESHCPYCASNTYMDSTLFWFTTKALGGWYYGELSLDSTDYVVMYALDGNKDTTLNEKLLTPAVDARGYDSVTLSCDNVFAPYPLLGRDQMDIDIWNGTTWVNIYSHKDYGGPIGDFYKPVRLKFNITAHANANLKARFVLRSEDYAHYWMMDNVQIKGHRSGYKVANALNNNATAYLAPNDTVHFAANNMVAATVTNLSNWNYGCTNLTVNRAGNTALPYELPNAAYYVTAKTLLINPAANNVNGVYDIALYYTQSEIAGWAATTGNTPQAITIVKTGGPISNITPATPNANGNTNVVSPIAQLLPYGTNWMLMGSFQTGFSGFGGGLGNSGSLPVELSSFYGYNETKNINVLHWVTEAEIDNHYFEVQRSTDGSNFKAIGKVAGSNNSSTQQQYTFTDSFALQGINYYRLKQVDYDADEEYSNTIAIKVEDNATFTLYPNPAASHLNINVPAHYNGYQVYITNSIGQQVANHTIKNTGTLLNVSELPKGIYNLSLTNGEMSMSKLFAKE